jgi:hypothetical protein
MEYLFLKTKDINTKDNGKGIYLMEKGMRYGDKKAK